LEDKSAFLKFDFDGVAGLDGDRRLHGFEASYDRRSFERQGDLPGRSSSPGLMDFNKIAGLLLIAETRPTANKQNQQGHA